MTSQQLIPLMVLSLTQHTATKEKSRPVHPDVLTEFGKDPLSQVYDTQHTGMIAYMPVA
jgi:hypothetical protein